MKYRSLGKLLDDRLLTEEHPGTTELIKKLKPVRKVKYLTQSELEDICRWKSSRAMRWIRQNNSAKIKHVTRDAFITRSERDKINHLTSLKGVGIPMASAILMLTGPQRYGVLDIRVWRLLYALGSVRKNPGGAGFTFNNWYNYLCILRHHAKRLGVSVRAVERTLFEYHKKNQVGRLYDKIQRSSLKRLNYAIDAFETHVRTR